MTKKDNNPPQISEKQRQYIETQTKRKRIIQMVRLLLLISFLIAWEMASRFELIDSFFFSSPTKLAECFSYMMTEHALFTHIGISLLETLLSFLFIMLISVVTASLLWRYEYAAKVLEPVLVILNSLPKSALAPLIIVWLGTGMKTIIIAGISVALFGCIINLYTCFRNTDPDKQKLIYILGGKKHHVFTKVILPSGIPTIISNMKVNIGLALVGVMIGEFLAAKQGLGYLIIYASQVFKLDWLILCILILCIIAIALYEILHIIERKICE
ncbi:MAG: ABC transporter permease [Lachnospiraceae bacterium]|nr:ABC transporter permease [Lachnospiraceae bacterium]